MKPSQSILKELLIVAVIATIAGFTVNAFSSKPIDLIRIPPLRVSVSDSALFAERPSAAETTKVQPNPEVTKPLPGGDEESSDEQMFHIITLDQLRRLLTGKRGMLVDARSPAEFAEGHIAGARNMFASEPESFVDQLVGIPRDSMIIIYCNNTHCHYGRELAEFLNAFSFTNLLLYDEGWDGWVEAGLPRSTEPAPK